LDEQSFFLHAELGAAEMPEIAAFLLKQQIT
jgi:hypothetical protein